MSVISIIGTCAFIAIFAFKILEMVTKGETDVKPYIIYLFGAVICFGINKAMFTIRTNARDQLEFDEFGNKKGNVYKNLSAKEKQEIDRQRLADQERLLSNSELKKVIHQGSKKPLEELNSLIGLQNVKNDVLKMQATMEYEKKYGKKNDEKSSHFCFLGSPGTGKTTVARIMTGILYEYKYIKKNQCIEIDASFLKGMTPDDTLKKTRMILQKSKGGVLFIDEAYSLLNGANSAEIIAELVKYMEDNKKDFVLILAGYQNEMKTLIDSNPGLYSRINKYLWFKDYDITELKEIFRTSANKIGYYINDNVYDEFELRIAREKRGKNFGNARTVKNILNKAIEKHAYNIMNGVLSKDKVYIICEEDIDVETEESRFFNR